MLCFLVAFANFMFGASFGWLSPVLQKHMNSSGEPSFTDEDCSYMVSAQNFGLFVGRLLLMLIADRCGRNTLIVSSAIVVSATWLGISLTKKVILLQLFRVATSIALGISSIIVSIYVAENSSPGVRGIFNSGTGLFLSLGMIFGCTVPTYCSFETTAYIFVAAALLNLTSDILLREPAQLLLAKGHTKKAENRFFWLRGTNDDSQKEFDDIKSNAKDEKANFSLAFMLDRHFLVAAVVSSLIRLTGCTPVVALISLILMPTKQFSSNELAILFCIFQCAASFLAPFTIENFRRRTLLMLSAILGAIFHILTAVILWCEEKGFEVWHNEWLLFGSVTAYSAMYGTLMLPLSVLAKVELLPAKFRTVGISTLSIWDSTLNGILGYSFLRVAATFGAYVNFLGFAASGLLLSVFCYFCLPETKGMPLTEIEKMLANSKKNGSDK